MKRFKKFAFVAVAAVTCFGMTAMTACGEVSDEEYVENVVEATQNQEVAGFGGTFSYKTTQTTDVAEKSYILSANDVSGKATLNALTGEVDSFVTTVEKNQSYTGSAYENKANGFTADANTDTTYTSTFLRDTYIFTNTSKTEITDYNSSVTLTLAETSDEMTAYLNNVMALLNGNGETSSDSSTDDVDLSGTISAVTQLALTYNALSISGSTLTIDLAKIISGVYTDFKAVVQSIDATTTVNDVIANENFKKLFTAVTSGVDTKEAYDTLVQSLTQSGEVSSEAIAVIPVPTEGQSLYDYVAALVKDETFSQAVLGDYATVVNVKTIGEMTVDSVLLLTGSDYTVAQLKQMVASSDFITTAEDGSVVVAISTLPITIRKAVVTLTVSKDYTLSGVGVAIDAYYSAENTIFGISTAITKSFVIDANLTVYTSGNIPALTDISGCKVGTQTVAEFIASKNTNAQ